MHSCTLQNNGDSITFQFHQNSEQATITYYFGYDKYTEIKRLFIHEAQEHWNKAVSLGYKEINTAYMTDSRFDF